MYIAFVRGGSKSPKNLKVNGKKYLEEEKQKKKSVMALFALVITDNPCQFRSLALNIQGATA